MELAQEILTQRGLSADALSQAWTGSIQLGDTTVTIRIEDRDRKFNINAADEIILHQSMNLLGINELTAKMIVDSILDWRDSDDATRENGAESSYYEAFKPKSRAKNHRIDYMPELLWVRGVTPTVYSELRELFEARLSKELNIFSELININTCSAGVLQLLPSIDQNIAQAIIWGRTGPDRVDGTADDMPYRSPQDTARVGGIPPQVLQTLSRHFTVRSTIFDVGVQVEVAGQWRNFHGVLHRLNGNRLQVLNLCEE
jgi:type II secretory pathway component PulK